MIYLDYAATTPVDKRVLETFNKVCIEYPGNSNSIHSLGMKSLELENFITNSIAKMLKIKASEIIYTSSSSESNNTAIKGICLRYKNRGRHIISTKKEHSSIIETLNYLETKGFIIDYVNLKSDGTIDLEHFKSLINDETILVTTSYIDSELGIEENINDLGNIIANYPKCFFHVDCTQAIGKVEVDFTNIDLASISAHKFFGLKGIALLIKKENIIIEPLIHGGKSTTIYRSGTPALPLIASLKPALENALNNIDEKYEYVSKLNKRIVEHLKKYNDIKFNTTDKSIPYVINISLNNIKPETFIHALDEENIYVSTKSACSKSDTKSEAVYASTHDLERSKHTIRISLSYKTTMEEIDTFLKVFDEKYQHLNLK